MRRSKLIPVLAAAFLVSVLWANCPHPQTEHARGLDAKEIDFVLEVLLGLENSIHRYPVTRWTKSASVTVHAGGPSFRNDVEDVISEINQTLAGTNMSLHLIQGEADIIIEGRPLGMLWKTKDIYKCEAWGADFGFVCPTLDKSSGAMLKAVIGVAENLPGKRTRSVILEELVQALGPQNDVPHYPDSLFFESDEHPLNWEKTLSPRDQQLLRFLYLHLKPGDNEARVREMIETHWKSVPASPSGPTYE